MKMAFSEAQKAEAIQEVPVGALIVDENGNIIGQSHNQKEREHNPCAHAEILAIQQATKEIKNWRLSRCTLYVTLEPCPMCLAAMVQGRIDRLVFGAYDFKGGAISLGYNLHNDSRLNHQFEICGGVMMSENSKLLSEFFKKRREATH